MTQAESDFVEEYTRSLLVGWADRSVRGLALALDFDADMNGLYIKCALDKGWLTKSTPPRVSAKGFTAAASFLKR
jgi:hypothetical protein